MPFTNGWNETSPDDNRVASLYGDDLRDMRVDIREREADFGAGLKAARLDPEAVFGDVNKGASFYATDEGILYRWDGTTWLVATKNRLFLNSTKVTITNPAVETDGLVVTIPAGYLTVGAFIEIRCKITGASVLGLLKFGATTLTGLTTVGATAGVTLQASLAVTTTSAQRGVAMTLIANDFLDLVVPDSVEAISGAIVVKTVAPAATGVFVHEYLTVRVRA